MKYVFEATNQTKKSIFVLTGEHTFRNTLSDFRFSRLKSRVSRKRMQELTVELDPDAGGHRYRITFLIVEVFWLSAESPQKHNWVLYGFATHVVREDGKIMVDTSSRWWRPAVDRIDVDMKANQGMITFHEANRWHP